jgi:hypothetical protein
MHRIMSMKSLLTLSALFAVPAITGTAHAEEPLSSRPEGFESRRAPAPEPREEHAVPRLQLSYERFSIGNLDGSAVPLESLHLDLYFLSRRWVRAGFELDGGRGSATLYGGTADLKHAMLGLNAGIQYPARVTPFIEGRLDGGILAGSLDGPLMLPGSTTTVSNLSAKTYLYARGIAVGASVYVVGRSYLTLSLGWLRSTWGAADYQASTGLDLKNVTHDSFVLKLGLGI